MPLINSVEISFMATGRAMSGSCALKIWPIPPMPTRFSTIYRPILDGWGTAMATPGRAPRSCALQHLDGVLQAAVHQVERAAERCDFVTSLHAIFWNVGLASADVAREGGDLLHWLDDENVHQHIQQNEHGEENRAQRRYEGQQRMVRARQGDA